MHILYKRNQGFKGTYSINISSKQNLVYQPSAF